MSNWQAVLLEPARVMLSKVGLFLVNILAVLVIIVAGWMIAQAVKTLLVRVLRAVKLDELSVRIELDSLLAKGGIKYSLSELIAVIVYWLALLITFVVAVNAVGLTVAADMLNKVILYVPNIVAALFILIFGMFIATLLKNIVQTVAINAGVSEDKVLGKIVQVVVMIFVIIMALEQLNMAVKTLELTLTIVLSAIGLGAALAFGLGCKEIAGKFVAELIEKLKSKK